MIDAEVEEVTVDLLRDDNREAWLQEVVERLRPRFEALDDLELPKLVRISTGWPSHRATAARKRVVGQCWMPESSADGVCQIFISPVAVDPVDVAAITMHEMIHAAGARSHKAEFSRPAKALGLVKPWTGTQPSDLLKADLAKLVEKLGPYPHANLIPGTGPVKTQGTRLLKVECPECGYAARITRKWISVGLPTCPCGMELEEVV